LPFLKRNTIIAEEGEEIMKIEAIF